MAIVNPPQRGGKFGTLNPAKNILDFQKIISDALAPLTFEIGKLKDKIDEVSQGRSLNRPRLMAEEAKEPDSKADNEEASLNKKHPEVDEEEEFEERKLTRASLLAKLKIKRFQKEWESTHCFVSQNSSGCWLLEGQGPTTERGDDRKSFKDAQSTMGAVKMKENYELWLWKKRMKIRD